MLISFYSLDQIPIVKQRQTILWQKKIADNTENQSIKHWITFQSCFHHYILFYTCKHINIHFAVFIVEFFRFFILFVHLLILWLSLSLSFFWNVGIYVNLCSVKITLSITRASVQQSVRIQRVIHALIKRQTWTSFEIIKLHKQSQIFGKYYNSSKARCHISRHFCTIIKIRINMVYSVYKWITYKTNQNQTIVKHWWGQFLQLGVHFSLIIVKLFVCSLNWTFKQQMCGISLIKICM